MNRLVLPMLLLLASGAAAKEPTGVECGLYAVFQEGDAGARNMYDGLRKGLELAHLPRVCLATKGKARAFLERLAQENKTPVFGFGDGVAGYLAQKPDALPCVLGLERFTVAGRRLGRPPELVGATYVYADLSVEEVGVIVRDVTRKKAPQVVLAWKAHPPHQPQAAGTFLAGAGVPGGLVGREGPSADLVMHVRLPHVKNRLSFDEALAHARKLRVPMVSDDRGRFGHGAVVTLAGRHALVGRTAAEIARRMRTGLPGAGQDRSVRGIEVWIDLKAADEQGIAVPLPFLARATRIKRGLRPAKPTR